MAKITPNELHLHVPQGNIHAKQWIPETLQYETPIVLLHDSLGSVDLWRDFPEILAKRLTRIVFAYDRLGFGRSSPREALPSIAFVEEEGEIYFPLIKKALGLEKYILLGHSVGGSMSVSIAANDPDCMAVITMASQAFVEDLTTAGIRSMQKIFEQPGQRERLKKWHGEKADWVLHAWTDIWLSSAFAAWSLASSIGKVRCPVLAIHGDKDEYGSVAFPEFISSRSGGESEMLILEGCGHFSHKEKQENVLDTIEAFIDKHAIA